MVEVGDGGRGSMCCMNVQMEAAVQVAGRGCSWRFRQGIGLQVFARKLRVEEAAGCWRELEAVEVAVDIAGRGC